jgi:hypothetical protein
MEDYNDGMQHQRSQYNFSAKHNRKIIISFIISICVTHMGDYNDGMQHQRNQYNFNFSAKHEIIMMARNIKGVNTILVLNISQRVMFKFSELNFIFVLDIYLEISTQK